MTLQYLPFLKSADYLHIQSQLVIYIALGLCGSKKLNMTEIDVFVKMPYLMEEEGKTLLIRLKDNTSGSYKTKYGMLWSKKMDKKDLDNKRSTFRTTVTVLGKDYYTHTTI